MTTNINPPDPAVEVVQDALLDVLRPSDPDATVLVTHGYRDALHVIAVSAAFEGCSARERNDLLGPQLRKLDPEVLLRISVVMAQTPDEHEAMLERRRLAVT